MFTQPERPGQCGIGVRQAARVLALVALVVLVACAPQGGAPEGDDLSTTLPSGHQRMLDLLEDIRKRTPDENAYLGDSETRAARRALADMPADAGDAVRWNVLWNLALEELRVGNEKESIEHLETAYGLIPEHLAREDWALQTTFQLGVAYMRYGETQNCSLRHTSDSCIAPIRGTGVHVDREGSTNAVRYFTRALETAPESSSIHLKSRWLLNIAHMTLGSYPEGVPPEHLVSPDLLGAGAEFPRFVNIAPEVGINTFNLSGSAIVADYDNDGALDIFTSTFDPGGQTHLFHNNNDGTFTDRYREAGLEGLYGGLNGVHADYDNDGDEDVLILRGAWLGDSGRHPNSLLRNDGDGTFTDVTFDAGLGEVHYPSQTGAWADYDNDGDLDLFIGNESDRRVHAPCQLFRNNGDGTFTDVAVEAGIKRRRFVKGSVWGDYDADRWPDLYLSAMGGANMLYRNNGDGTFTDVADAVGVTGPLDSFAVWFWDFDNDGVLDLYSPSYGLANDVAMLAASYLRLPHEMEGPALYRGNGRGGFEEVSAEYGLTQVHASMGANRGDLDNDGYPDFYLGTGYPTYEALTPNAMYHNDRGRGFTNVTYAGGFGHLQKGHAVSFADLDNDGDQDIFEQMGGAYPGDAFPDALFENPGFGNHWIAIRLVGTESNRSAIGARIRVDVVEDGTPRSIYKHVDTGGSFGSNPLRQTVGLGRATNIERLEIYWPTSDITQIFEDVETDRFVRIVEGEDDITPIPLQKLTFGATR